MQLLEREKMLELPEGTVFGRFYPELMTADFGVDDIRPRPFVDLCIKGKTEGENFEFCSLTDCLHNHAHVDDIDRDHMALCYGTTDSHFTLDLESMMLDLPGGHAAATVSEGHEAPPRQLYAVWSLEEVDALASRMHSAVKHLRNARGMEM